MISDVVAVAWRAVGSPEVDHETGGTWQGLVAGQASSRSDPAAGFSDVKISRRCTSRPHADGQASDYQLADERSTSLPSPNQQMADPLRAGPQVIRLPLIDSPIDSPLVGSKPGTHRRAERCARCGIADHLVSIRRVVSRNFTGYDGWLEPWRPGLCRACRWAYRTPLLRMVPHLVVRFPELIEPLTPARLHATLSRPLAADSAVVVPLRPGRKHVFCAAMWSTATTEDGSLPWSSSDADRLRAVDRLRAAGFPTRTLLEPAPPYQVLRQLPARRYDEIFSWWADLEPWREQPAWLRLAAKTVSATTLAA